MQSSQLLVGGEWGLRPRDLPCMTQGQKVMLMAAVGSARRELELQIAGAALHYPLGGSAPDAGFLQQPQPMDFPLSQLEHHRELHGQAALPVALKQALQPLFLLVSSWSKLRERRPSFGRFRRPASTTSGTTSVR